MVRTHKYNEAFTKALMASDLPLVVNLMEMVESDKIFGPDLPGGTTLEETGHNSAYSHNHLDPNLQNSIKKFNKKNQNFKSEIKIPAANVKRRSNNYDSLTSSLITGADSFFARPSSARHSNSGFRSDSGLKSDSGQSNSSPIYDSSPADFGSKCHQQKFQSDTEKKLSQFFLLNKY
jgi:hypothetical protein